MHLYAQKTMQYDLTKDIPKITFCQGMALLETEVIQRTDITLTAVVSSAHKASKS